MAGDRGIVLNECLFAQCQGRKLTTPPLNNVQSHNPDNPTTTIHNIYPQNSFGYESINTIITEMSKQISMRKQRYCANAVSLPHVNMAIYVCINCFDLNSSSHVIIQADLSFGIIEK